MNKLWRSSLLAAGLCAASSSFAASTENADEAALMERVNGFYSWVLKNGKQVDQLQPVIRDIPRSKKFVLDTRHLKAFTSKFIASGHFAPGFPALVNSYYDKYRQQFAAYSDAEFAQIARDGRGPLMDTEDMDIFFCAQEYEYTKDFISKMKPKTVKVDGDQGSMTVVSDYQWETEFRFVRLNGKWLIAGYCVFK